MEFVLLKKKIYFINGNKYLVFLNFKSFLNIIDVVLEIKKK